MATKKKDLQIAVIGLGRFGSITMLYALTKKLKPLGIRYPEERILIG